MSLAARTRAAVRDRPFLLAALRAGVVNYAAAAAFLDLDGDDEAVAAALRRYADDLTAFEVESRDAVVRMRSGVGLIEEGADTDADPVVAVGGVGVAPGSGDLTAVIATGDVDPTALAAVIERLDAAHVVVDAAGVAGETLAVVVPRSDGPAAIELVEDALDAVPA